FRVHDALARPPAPTPASVAGTLPPSTAGAAPPPPVGGYELFEELGRGGMGVVYRARQSGLNRIVALKMLRTHDAALAEERLRFRREAEAAARLLHPHIVQIFEVGELDRQPFLALELVTGGSLDQKLKRDLLPAGEAAALLETLARAVHYAHEH